MSRWTWWHMWLIYHPFRQICCWCCALLINRRNRTIALFNSPMFCAWAKAETMSIRVWLVYSLLKDRWKRAVSGQCLLAASSSGLILRSWIRSWYMWTHILAVLLSFESSLPTPPGLSQWRAVANCSCLCLEWDGYRSNEAAAELLIFLLCINALYFSWCEYAALVLARDIGIVFKLCTDGPQHFPSSFLLAPLLCNHGYALLCDKDYNLKCVQLAATIVILAFAQYKGSE